MLGEGLDDRVDGLVSLLDASQGFVEQLGRVRLPAGDRRRLLGKRLIENRQEPSGARDMSAFSSGSTPERSTSRNSAIGGQ